MKGKRLAIFLGSLCLVLVLVGSSLLAACAKPVPTPAPTPDLVHRSFGADRPSCGSLTSPTSAPGKGGATSLSSSTSTPGGLSAGSWESQTSIPGHRCFRDSAGRPSETRGWGMIAHSDNARNTCPMSTPSGLPRQASPQAGGVPERRSTTPWWRA